ncbi:MAG TPA: amino acid adenylation domain-containing protein, partial [Longimicrobiaceae bacterium]|nr:amino acid adenylation domain-containing protein [Longimicrobiaceae bacterium]
TDPPDPAPGGLRVEPLEEESATAKFDLSLLVSDDGRRLEGQLNYRTDLFEAATVRRLLEAFERLLEGVAADPERRIGEIGLLSAAERKELESWNATASAFPQACVHELFAVQAARTPEAVALVHGGESVTYTDLEERANRLAHHLRRRGVAPDVRVALCLERSVDMLVAVLGILKAGGAYVPLDPAYPQERLSYMLADCGARVLLTQAGLAERLLECGAAAVRLDADRDEIARESAAAPAVEVHPQNLAYVIYTSGSTGTPKGVAMPHGPLVNLLAWQEGDWRGPRVAVTLHFATISFDASFHEIFSCWCTGGRLVLADEEARWDPEATLRLLEAEGVERLFLPSVALQHVAEEAVARGTPLPALREVQTAGEQLRASEAIRGWLGALGVPLHNHYGPSETHVVTSHTLHGPAGGWPLLPPIGRPIANTRAYVLDAHLRPVLPGVPGELYLGGECLARGYLGRPELTAERFLPDPFSAPGGRMYRTGDRVRWLADGTLEFHGRVDQQVKIRGFRVEPGEVVEALLRHPGVREAVVTVWEDVSGEKRLAAYVVPGDGAELAPEELRERLRERLPEYMVPAAYVVLESLPLTPSGKTDRRALPAPAGRAGRAYAAPRTPTEEALCAIWAEVLGLERVGIDDHFFELGGHSLRATRIASRVRQTFGVDVPLRALFATPTVAALAAAVDEELIRSVDASELAELRDLLGGIP